MRRKREDDDFRRAEAPKNAIAKKLQRMDENMRHQEQQRDRVGRAERRSDDIYREEEKERDRMHHATRREDESYRDIEKERDRIKHATRRDDTYFKQAEQQQNTIRKAISRHRAQADFDILLNPDDATPSDTHIDDIQDLSINDNSQTEDNDPPLTETLMQEDQLIMAVAPGEGMRPLSLLLDLDTEELSFPSIYCGIKRKLNPEADLSYTDIAKSELRRFDPRCRRADKILYSYRLVQTHRIASNINICIRKKKKRGIVTVGNLLNRQCVQSLIQHDDGYRLLSNIVNSPSYLEEKKKDVMAMIRQLGLPTFFITTSAAETKWPELISMLHNRKYGTELTDEEVSNLKFDDKADLIRHDPIGCVMAYDRREKAMDRFLIKPSGGIFHPYLHQDFFKRKEVQQRGSIHTHRMDWIQDAPKFEKENPLTHQACCEFIDEFITCRKDETGDMKEVLAYQIHNHSHPCEDKRRGCRFGFPIPPMRTTRILLPLPPDQVKLYKQQFTNIKEKLSTCGRHAEEINFDTFLQELGLNEEDYILSIRSNLRIPKVFLRRGTHEIYINAYNRKLLLCWRANIDIQFVLDPYACATYVVNYISKSDRGVSKILRQVSKEIREGNFSLKERLSLFANAFAKSSEVSAQEAACCLLKIPMTQSSRDVTFINTNRPDDRGGHLHCMPTLAFYRVGIAHPAHAVAAPMYLTKRANSRIIRYRRIGLYQGPDNFYREQLMLYVPWRDENKDLLDIDHVKVYQNRLGVITQKRQIYDPGFPETELEVELTRAQEDDEVFENDLLDHNPVDFIAEDQDFAIELGDSTSKFMSIRPPKLIPTEDYLQLLRTLNECQRKYLLNLLHSLKARSGQNFHIIHGQAGVGKSRLIHAIVQCILRILEEEPGFSGEAIPVLVAAATGKAAFNVSGMTLHSAFRLPPSQYGGKMAPLDHGDFYQLSPVFGQFVFEESKEILGPIIGNPLWERFRLFELKEIMRQKDDAKFATALNRLSIGMLEEEDIEMFKSREIRRNLVVPDDATWLFYSNADCDNFNREAINRAKGPLFNSYAIDRVQGGKIRESQKAMLESAEYLSLQQTGGMPYHVALRVGLRYMITTNIDVSHGLFNGATGKLMGVIEKPLTSGGKAVKVVFMEFSDKLVGQLARSNNLELLKQLAIPLHWTPVFSETKALNSFGRYQGMEIVRRQIPLVAANAISIHKSQSLSIPNTVANIPTRGLRRDAIYVAMSRAPSLSGLFIGGTFNAPRAIDTLRHPVALELSRLRKLPFPYSLRYLPDQEDPNKIVFHNIQSFRAHCDDILADKNYMASDILCFCETRTLVSDMVELPGFSILHRIDSPTIQSSIGTLVLRSDSYSPIISDFQYSQGNLSFNKHFQIVQWRQNNVRICMLYRSPQYSTLTFLQDIRNLLISTKNTPVIVFGDFNLNFLAQDGCQMKQIFYSMGLRLITPAEYSTDGNTSIDACFSNIQGVSAWFYESYCSYHKPICVTWPDDIAILSSLESVTCPIETELMEVGVSDNEICLETEDSEMDVDSENLFVDGVILEPIPSIHLGIQNLGNTCYINAILHLIYDSPSIQEFLKISEDRLSRCLTGFLHALVTPVPLGQLRTTRLELVECMPSYPIGMQDDPHLFLLDILQNLSNSGLSLEEYVSTIETEVACY
ncbi:uncharacterized protein LOC118433080 [Folsomia candida]|uniref:uncharacterized protein LOC118433080 n=1 Tax=Folsomia candida TaxID=158441 RepID=UPI0016051A43|nr:uncharacterized protein LOC118433080 [Folsomia candida]